MAGVELIRQRSQSGLSEPLLRATAEAESEVAALTVNAASPADELEDLARALRRSRVGSEQAQPAGERE